MAKALLITRADLVRFTAVSGGTDFDKIIQFISISQDIHIQNYLGTDLLVKIQNEIEAGTLADPYLSFTEDYVKPCLIHWAMVEYLPYSAFTISNKGVYKHSSENAVNADLNEIEFMLQKERNTAKYYTDRMIEYLCNNESDFPEYNTNANSDVYPDKDAFKSNWYL